MRHLASSHASRSRPLMLAVLALLFQHLVADVKADAIDRYIRDEMDRQKIPGLALAVVKHGKLKKARGYGLSNVEHSIPVRPHTVFQSGSIAKQFTAAAVLLLTEEGRLGLDEPISRYLTNAPPDWQAITIRHLLNHTSGIPDGFLTLLNYRQDYTEDELLALASGLKLQFAPGSDWNYSNTGYDLLGIIIHRVTGKFYGDFLQERVFTPLGMTATRVISETDIVPHRAAGYHSVGGKLRNQDWVSPSLNTTAAGSLYLTALDLAKWDAALYTDRPLSARLREQMWTPAKFGSEATSSPKMRDGGYGFGWSLDRVAGHRVVQHGGQWQGFETFITRYMDAGVTIIVLANRSPAEVEAIAHGVARRSLSLLKRRQCPDPDPTRSAYIADVMRSGAGGTSKSEWFTDRARRQGLPERISRSPRLKGVGGLKRFELLDVQARDEVSRLTYRATCERETLLLTVDLDEAGKIARFHWATE